MNISKELLIIRELLSLTQEELAKDINVTYETINRWKLEKVEVDNINIEKVYNYAFSKGIYLNEIVEQLLLEDFCNENEIVLFYGCKKDAIEFPLDFKYSKVNNDFGVGFYLGKSFKQATTYIVNAKSSLVYAFKLNVKKLKIYQFNVDREWMIAIAYYRGWLDQYSNSEIVKSIIDKVNNCDVIVAPIADNRMFDIISEFVRGEITDAQCEHALAITNLGNQYVLKSEKALNQVELLWNLYVSSLEKEKLFKIRLNINDISQNKVKVARIEYRGNGQYIDELLV